MFWSLVNPDMSGHIHLEPATQTKTGLERIPNLERGDKSNPRSPMIDNVNLLLVGISQLVEKIDKLAESNNSVAAALIESKSGSETR